MNFGTKIKKLERDFQRRSFFFREHIIYGTKIKEKQKKIEIINFLINFVVRNVKKNSRWYVLAKRLRTTAVVLPCAVKNQERLDETLAQKQKLLNRYKIKSLNTIKVLYSTVISVYLTNFFAYPKTLFIQKRAVQRCLSVTNKKNVLLIH